MQPGDRVEARKDDKVNKGTESQVVPKEELEVEEIKNEKTSSRSSADRKVPSDEVNLMDSENVQHDHSEEVAPDDQTKINLEKETIDSKSHVSGSESQITQDEEVQESHKLHNSGTEGSPIDTEGETPLIELVNEETEPDQNEESTSDQKEAAVEKDEVHKCL